MQLIGTEQQKVIIYMGGGKDFISQAEEDIIIQASTMGKAKGCKLKNGNWVTFSSIARIISESDYYNENPNDRPAEPKKEFNGGNQQVRQPTQKDKELMREGFLKQQMDKHGISREEASVKLVDFLKGNLLTNSHNK